MASSPLKTNFTGFTEKIKALPASQLKKLDGILSDIANHAYDTYEYILELEGRIQHLSDSETKSMINDLTVLQE